MRRLSWLLWRLRLRIHRFPIRHQGDPNFLFSTWPAVRWGYIPSVVIEPTGGDDTPRIRAAVNRLNAVGGGTLRFSAGDYTTQPFYL